MTIVLLLCLIVQDPVELKTADEVVQQVRVATQFSGDKIPEQGLRTIGTGTYAGMPAQYELLFNRQGHFVQTTNSRLQTAIGYDGENAWSKDIAGEQRILDLADRCNVIFTGLLITGRWLDADSGMSYTLPADGFQDGVYTLHFMHDPTEIAGELRVDGTTWLPLDCTVVVEGRRQTTAWSEVIEYNGMRFPKKFGSGAEEGMQSYVIETIEAAPTFVKNPYEAIAVVPEDTLFDDTLPAELEVKRAITGHLLVKPLVNGKDIGWFILDSGAGANVLATSAIEELGLETFGELPAVGMGGAVKTSFSRPETIRLGRATFKDPLVVGLDLAFLDGPMGVPIGGIIGYGSLYRCIVEIDMEQGAVALYSPRTYDQSQVGDHWQRLFQSSRISCIEAEFEGHRGIFKLDTGAGNSTVAIHAPYVEKFNLLENRKATETFMGGVGGQVKVCEGALDYFEIAGHRFENVVATFVLENKGALNSADTMGNIGGALVKPFRMVFDYQNNRIAFVKR